MRIEQYGKDHFMMMGAEEIVSAAERNSSWMRHQQGVQRGNFSRDESLDHWKRMVTTGDNALVAESEKLLSQIEDQVPMSRGWRNIDDVVGAVPNVPAYLAGRPQCMRRRQRVDHESAPLCVFMNLSSSMGISRETILRRGIVLLALVRQLIEHRPVELWVGTALGDRGLGVTGTAAWRIDTAPLDLARAAFHIADPSMSRLFGYAMCESMPDTHLGGFGYDANTDETKRRMLQSAGGWGEMLYIGAVYYSDPMVNDPVSWLKKTLAKYTGNEQQE